MKRLILIIILIVVALLGVAYFIFTGIIESPLAAPENQQAVGELPGEIPSTGFTNDNTNNGVNGLPVAQTQNEFGLPKLMKVLSGPIAGYTAYQKKYTEVVDDERIERKRLVATYVDRTNGNVSEYDILSGTQEKLSNTTITRLQSAEVSTNGLVIGRSVDEGDVVQTFIGRVASGTTELSYAYIDNNLLEVHLSPNQSSLLISRVSGGKFQAVITTTSGINGKVIFESPISEWKVSWRDNSSVIITSKAAYGMSGVSYLVTTAGVKTLITSGVLGLQVSAAPTANKYLVSSFYRGGPSTYLKVGSNQVSTTAALIPEKCAWRTTGTAIICGAGGYGSVQNMPDIWYKGLILLNDNVTVTDGTTGTSRIVESPASLSVGAVDVINPQLVDDRYFFFMNKSDGSLWMADVGN